MVNTIAARLLVDRPASRIVDTQIASVRANNHVIFFVVRQAKTAAMQRVGVIAGRQVGTLR